MTDVETMVADFIAEQRENNPAERWRKPVKPVVVEPDNSEVRLDGDVLRGGYNATFDEETIERFRVGRACLKCWEVHEEAFPAKCSLCGYPMKDRQTTDFQEAFGGKKWVGPSTSIPDEIERMKYEGAKRRHTPGSSILLPRGVSTDPA